jgi:hypothetical protein
MRRGAGEERLINPTRRQLLILTGIATVVLEVVLAILDRNLRATGGPSVLSFEFVGNKQHAAQILAEWGAGGRDQARLGLWIDFAFMLSYGAFVTLAAIATREFARDHGWRLLAMAGVVAPLFAISAALFDATENIALLLILGGHGGNAAPVVATACASFKFALITLAIIYIAWGLCARFLLRLRSLAS